MSLRLTARVHRVFRCPDDDCGIDTVQVCWQAGYTLGWPTRLPCPGCHQLMVPVSEGTP